MFSDSRRLVVLIPALNEQETIGRVVNEIPRRLAGVGRVEVIVVDDGSDDLTADRAWACGRRPRRPSPGQPGPGGGVQPRDDGGAVARCRHRRHARRRRAARCLGHSPADRPDRRGVGRPRRRRAAAHRSLRQGSPVRRMGNRVGSGVARRMLNLPLSDVTSGYRAFSREALLQVHVSSGFTYTLETLIQAAGKRLRMAEVVVSARRREVGTSRMTHSIVRYIGRTGNHAFRTVVSRQPTARVRTARRRRSPWPRRSRPRGSSRRTRPAGCISPRCWRRCCSRSARPRCSSAACSPTGSARTGGCSRTRCTASSGSRPIEAGRIRVAAAGHRLPVPRSCQSLRRPDRADVRARA